MTGLNVFSNCLESAAEVSVCTCVIYQQMYTNYMNCICIDVALRLIVNVLDVNCAVFAICSIY